MIAIPIDAAEDRVSQQQTQSEALEQREMNDKILAAVNSLPDHERSATMLYYISGYSQDEIAEFLDVPVTTIKKRLHSARKRLREMLVDLVEDSLRQRRPSRDELFSTRVIAMLKAARTGDAAKVKELLLQDPRLIAARDPFGNTALILAVNYGHDEIAELLLAAGERPDLYEAASIGRTDLVVQFLSDDPSLLDSVSPEGFGAIALAAHFGHIETLELLIARGGDLNAVSRHAISVTPLHAALFGGQLEAAKVLVAAGADVTPKRGGTGWPRAGWTALHYCAGLGFAELVESLIERGADTDAVDDEGKTPLQVAFESDQKEVASILLNRVQRG